MGRRPPSGRGNINEGFQTHKGLKMNDFTVRAQPPRRPGRQWGHAHPASPDPIVLQPRSVFSVDAGPSQRNASRCLSGLVGHHRFRQVRGAIHRIGARSPGRRAAEAGPGTGTPAAPGAPRDAPAPPRARDHPRRVAHRCLGRDPLREARPAGPTLASGARASAGALREVVIDRFQLTRRSGFPNRPAGFPTRRFHRRAPRRSGCGPRRPGPGGPRGRGSSRAAPWPRRGRSAAVRGCGSTRA